MFQEEFEKVFPNKFYPRLFCDSKRNEFMSLVKSSMIVDEYEKKFNEFTKYVQALVIDVVDTCKHFEDGLRIEIMSPMTTTSY